jgi:hypothetical protein
VNDIVKEPSGANEIWWRTLLRLLAFPLFVSALTFGAWLAGGSQAAARVANAELVWAAAGPVLNTAAALGVLKTGSDRALALPTPIMLWSIYSAQRSAGAPWMALTLAHVATLVLLFGCWQQRRKLARAAAICCGTASLWVQLSGGLLHG